MMQLCRPLAQIKIKKFFFLTVGLCNMLDSWLGIFFPRHFNTRIHKGVLKPNCLFSGRVLGTVGGRGGGRGRGRQ